ncbi:MULTISPECIES: DUF1772 domain-containing protein [Niastella]|uniref:DUF1772 domain-containing protein n=1 Tax=Niastella soli TaxID=2821487 RepID=A0ABS3YUI3_9BACT|nr:DUF1772 domain-containing protein [Niastella soli]MBO9201548.1 DUF1772 domain-containing protein [Niastella soli]
MLRRTLLFITGILLVLITGVFWGTWFSLSRTMDTLSGETFVVIGKQIMKNVALGMSIMMPLAIVGLIALLLITGRRKKDHFYWLLFTLIMFVAALAITLFIEVPLDNQIKTWTDGNLPHDWGVVRDRWQVYHSDRTFLSLAGMACYLMAVIKRYT